MGKRSRLVDKLYSRPFLRSEESKAARERVEREAEEAFAKDAERLRKKEQDRKAALERAAEREETARKYRQRKEEVEARRAARKMEAPAPAPRPEPVGRIGQLGDGRHASNDQPAPVATPAHESESSTSPPRTALAGWTPGGWRAREAARLAREATAGVARSQYIPPSMRASSTSDPRTDAAHVDDASSSVAATNDEVEATSDAQSEYKSPFLELTKVFVGDADPILVHKCILAKVPFFEKCMGNGMKESLENEIHLPEDDPEIFDMLLKYLYMDCTPVSVLEVMGEWCNVNVRNEIRLSEKSLPALSTKVLRLFILVNKYGMEAFGNKLTNLFVERACRGAPLEVIETLPQAGLSDCKIQTFLVLHFAHLIKNGLCLDESFEAWIEGGAETVLRLFRELATLAPRVNTSYEDLTKKPCRWHTHAHTERCANWGRKQPNSTMNGNA